MNFVKRTVGLALVGAATASSAWAADATLDVSATVANTCAFIAGNRTISFDLNPYLTNVIGYDASQQLSLQYKCTNGLMPTFQQSLSNPTFLTNTIESSQVMPFQLSLSGAQEGTGFSTGQEKYVLVNASVAANTVSTAYKGYYQATVRLFVTP